MAILAILALGSIVESSPFICSRYSRPTIRKVNDWCSFLFGLHQVHRPKFRNIYLTTAHGPYPILIHILHRRQLGFSMATWRLCQSPNLLPKALVRCARCPWITCQRGRFLTQIPLDVQLKSVIFKILLHACPFPTTLPFLQPKCSYGTFLLGIMHHTLGRFHAILCNDRVKKLQLFLVQMFHVPVQIDLKAGRMAPNINSPQIAEIFLSKDEF